MTVSRPTAMQISSDRPWPSPWTSATATVRSTMPSAGNPSWAWSCALMRSSRLPLSAPEICMCWMNVCPLGTEQIVRFPLNLPLVSSCGSCFSKNLNSSSFSARIESGIGSSAAARSVARSPGPICSIFTDADPKSIAIGEGWAENIENPITRLRGLRLPQRTARPRPVPSTPCRGGLRQRPSEQRANPRRAQTDRL